MVGWYLALAASQQSSVRLLQFAPDSLECLDANHSFLLFALACKLQTAALFLAQVQSVHTIDLPYLRMFHHKAGLSTM